MTTYYLAYWAEGWLEVIHHLDDVSTAFPLGEGVTVEPGRHKYTELWFNYQPPPGPLLRTLADARAGGFYDGWRVQLTVEPTWNLSRKLEIGGAYELNRIRFPDRSTGLDAHVARLRIGAAASARLSATALWGVHLRLRYTPSGR